NCIGDLDRKKFETVFQLIPLLSDAVEIRSLVLGGKECISTFFNPNLEPWQRVGILRCELREGFSVDLAKLWAIMPEIKQAAIIQPVD
ncbi:MAG: toxin, partial [Campylobacter lanienae]|nr:toxin [Campylobacter lanienae]